MIGALISWLVGGGIDKILSRLTAARWNELAAQTDADRLAAQLQVQAIEAELAAHRETTALRRQTAGQWEMRLLVLVTGLPCALHFGAVCLVSMFPGLGWTVLRLPAPMDEWQGRILLSLFGLSAASAAMSAIARWRK